MHGSWPQGGTTGGEGLNIKVAEGVYFRGCIPGEISVANGQRDRNASYFAYINPPGFGTDVYWRVTHRVTEGMTERIAGINQGKIVDRGEVRNKG